MVIPLRNSNQRSQLVPVPIIEYHCNRSRKAICCKRIFLPLCTAFARTIHKFQGMSAGPVDEGKIPNPYECIVCDPGERDVEGRHVGMLYTTISRGTTLGDDKGAGSAVYFQGKDFNEARVRNLGKGKGSTQFYPKVLKRNAWVDYLKKHEKKPSYTRKRQRQILAWASTTKVSYDDLHDHIAKYTDAFLPTSTGPPNKRRRHT